MADDKLNVGIQFTTTGNAEAAAAFSALGTAAAATAAEFDAAAVSAKAMADAVTGASALSALGIKATAPGVVNAEGAGLVTVAAEEQANAQAILNGLKLEAIAVTKAEAAATIASAAASAEAAAAKRAEAVATEAGAAASTEGAVAAERLAVADVEVATAARAAGASSEAMAAEAGGASAAFGGMWTQILAVVAALEAYSKAKEFIETGIGFNAAIESARLGIASSVNAMATLTDAEGHALKGQEAFAAATSVADDQIQKLFADSARTSTTVQQLVTTYQSAIGAGLAAGATLDQIRRLTTDAALAAGAFNVPYSQLSVTLVQLLNGHAQLRNRLTADLHITTAMLKDWKEQGILVDKLLEKFGQFESLGTRVQGTWRGIQSNIKEFTQQFSGAATSGAFTTLETGIKGQLGRVFDFNTGKLTSNVAGAADLMREGLGGAAQLIVDLVGKIVDGLEKMGTWFEQNRAKAEAMGRDFLELVTSTGRIVLNITELVIKITAWAAQSLVVQSVLRAIGDIIGLVADHLQAIATISAVIAGLWSIEHFSGLVVLVAALGGPVTIVLGAIAALVVGIEALRIAHERATAAAEAARAQTVEHAASTGALVGQYEALAKQLASGKLHGDLLHDAQVKLKTVSDELIKLSPDFRDALENETGKITDQAAAVEKLNEAHIQTLALKADEAAARATSLEAQETALAKKEHGAAGLNLLQVQADLADVRKQIVAAHLDEKTAETAIAKARDAEAAGVKTGGITVTPKKEDPDKPQKDAKGLAAAEAAAQAEAIKEQASQIERTLAEQLAHNELSYAEYFARLNAIELTALDVQIAAKQKELAGTKDKKEQVTLGTDIAKLEAEKTAVIEKNKQKQNQLEAQYDKQRTTTAIEALKAEGETALAYELEWAEKHSAQLARALAQDDQATIDALNKEHDIGVAANRAKDLTTRAQGTTSETGGEVQSIKDQVQERAISEARGRELIIAAYQREALAIQHALDAARALATLSPTAENISKVDALAKQYAGVQKAIVQARQASEGLKREIAGALANDFTQFFTHTIAGAHSAGEAFRSLAASVIQSLQQIIAKMIEAQIEGMLLKALGVGIGGGLSGGSALGSSAIAGSSFLAGLADGGHVSGPGGPTEDRVPAMLSSGEYVVQASAVDRMGVGFFDAVNAGAMRMTPHAGGGLARYAEGGFIGRYASGGMAGSAPGAAPGAAGSGKLDIHVSHDPSLTLDLIRSPEGHKVILEALQRNQKSARQALRVG